MKKLILAGATDQTVDIFIQDSSSTTGAGLTGLVFNSAGLTCYYRKGATGSATQLTLATQTVGGAHSDGGFVEIDATNMPGMYRLDLSDTIVASAGSVSMMLQGAADMAPLPIELQVVSFDPEDAVRLGLTALPNAAADAAGGLPISDAGGLDLDTLNSNVSAILTDTGTTLDDHLTDIKGTGFVKDTHSLTDIEGYVDLIDDGTSGLAKIATDAAAILVDTAEIGAAGAGLTEAGGDGDHLTAINLPDQAMNITGDITGNLSGSVTGSIGSLAAQAKADVNAEVDSAFTTQMADSVSADGSIPTREQALYMVNQFLMDFAISGTTYTVKKVDGSTTLATFSLDDATSPTSLTRAT